MDICRPHNRRGCRECADARSRTTTSPDPLTDPLSPLNPLSPLSPANPVSPVYGGGSSDCGDRTSHDSSTPSHGGYDSSTPSSCDF